MNYIAQIKGFWIAQELHQLGTSEIAFYFYLLEVSNKTGWTGSFQRNNYKVMADLSIKSRATLQSMKDRLKTAGIIDYKQQNGVANCKYVLNDLSIFCAGSQAGSQAGMAAGSQAGMAAGSQAVNINQTETKTKPNNKESDKSPPTSKKIIVSEIINSDQLPFQSEKFKIQFEKLLKTKKWLKKNETAVWAAVEKMKKYDEEFVIELIERAIIGEWQGLFFANTDIDYKKYLNNKNGNSNAIFKGNSERSYGSNKDQSGYAGGL